MNYGVECRECGGEIPYSRNGRTTVQFCSQKCRRKERDRRRYAADPERERERSRRYYREHREEILEKAAAKRGRPRTSALTECSECGGPLEGPRRVVCSSRCRDARFRRLHPDAYAAKERRKVERRRERRREARGA